MEKKLDICLLSECIKKNCPDISFAYLFGSAKSGIIPRGSDIDLGVYLTDTQKKSEYIVKISEILETLIGNTPVDIIFLNDASPILAFEALKGKQLFVREKFEDIYTRFYSLTCREFESEMYWMKRQLEYRNYEVQCNY